MLGSIFNDAEISNSLHKNGYAKITPFTASEVDTLLHLYQSTRSTKKSQNAYLYLSIRECDFDTSIAISAKIKTLLLPYFNTIASDFDLYGGAFLSKPIMEENEFSLHQDFSLVDKVSNNMYAIWIALQDTNVQNGCKYIVDKSHRLFENYISATYNNHKIHRKNILKESIVNIELKAGEGIIFCDNVFHGSYPNKSSQERIAVTARISNKDAQFVYYNKKNEYIASQYRISPEDLIANFDDFQKGIIPKHINLLKEVPYIHTPITDKSLNKALAKEFYPKKGGFLDKVKNLFSLSND